MSTVPLGPGIRSRGGEKPLSVATLGITRNDCNTSIGTIENRRLTHFLMNVSLVTIREKKCQGRIEVGQSETSKGKFERD